MLRHASLLSLLVVALCGGCAGPRAWVKVPALPEWRAPASGVVTAAQVAAEIQRHAPGVYYLQSDARYVAVDHAWVLELVSWSRRFVAATGVRYRAEVWDCDKFAKALSVAAELSAARGGANAQVLVGRIYVLQQAAWGGVAAGGGHALNVFLSERGIHVLEPQTGAIAPLAEYPNRTAIYAVFIGG